MLYLPDGDCLVSTIIADYAYDYGLKIVAERIHKYGVVGAGCMTIADCVSIF